MPVRFTWLSVAALLLVSPLLHATPLPPSTGAVYTFTVTGSGALDGVSFTDQLITLTTDTTLASVSTLSNGTTDRALNVPTTVSILGVGSDNLTDNISFVVARAGNPNAGISDQTLGLGLVVLQGSAFASVSMFDTVGPVQGNGLSNYFAVTTPTSNGSLYLSDVTSGSYTASIGEQPSAVPEPSSLWLLGTGIAGATVSIRKRFTHGQLLSVRA